MTNHALTADLVLANHILAHEGVVDAFGHVSMRHPHHPEQFLLSRSLSPELISASDIMAFDQQGVVVGEDQRKPYLERFIHAAIYAARPDVNAIVHSHAHEVLPFTVVRQSLRPVIHLAAILGQEVPVWDIRDAFGDETDLLVSNFEQGRDLARFLADRDGVLMRGHGSVVVASSIPEATLKAIYLSVNAQVLAQAKALGHPVYLSAGEQARSKATSLGKTPITRAWDYYVKRAAEARRP